jgi:integrase
MLTNELSPSTVRLTHANLHKALKQAVQWRKLEVNPADAVTLPKGKHREMRYLSAEKAARLLQVAEGGTHALLFQVLAQTGMRISEVQGLRWKDIDLVRGLLHVRRSVKKLIGEWIEESPKTVKGKCTLALSADLVKRLSDAQTGQLDAYVFNNGKGQPVSHRSVADRLKRLQKMAGFQEHEYITIHGLRHTHATMLKEAGRDIQDIQERLGHASPTITAMIYTHFSEERQRQMTDTLDTLFPAQPEQPEEEGETN